MEDRFKLKYLILSLLMIAFGLAAFYFMFIYFKIHEGIGLLVLLFIPLSLTLIVLPLYSGFALLIEELRCLFHIPPKKKD